MEEAIKFKQELLEKEYGSNIKKLAEYVASIKDKKERTEKAKLLVQLVEKMHPSIKYAENAEQRVWSDLYLMSGEALDVDFDFEKPNLKEFLAKPERVQYSQEKPMYMHYGRNIELLMNKLSAEADGEVRDQSLESMGKLMKTFYHNWNKEGVDDSVIAAQMKKLSNGKLEVPREKLDEEMNFDSKHNKRSNRHKGKSNKHKKGRKN